MTSRSSVQSFASPTSCMSSARIFHLGEKFRSPIRYGSHAIALTPVPGGDPVTVQLLRGASGLPARWPRLDQLEGSSFK